VYSERTQYVLTQESVSRAIATVEGVTFSVLFSPSSKCWPHMCHQKQLITFKTTNKYNNKQKPNKEHNHRQTYKNNIKGTSPKTHVLYLWSRESGTEAHGIFSFVHHEKRPMGIISFLRWAFFSLCVGVRSFIGSLKESGSGVV
jgi:hypothetical protein